MKHDLSTHGEVVRSPHALARPARPAPMERSAMAGAPQILRLRPGELSSQRVGTVVVIDVLRMTSTAAALMRRPSCTSVAVAATIEHLPRLSLRVSDCVIVSELPGAAWDGMWVDNSPAQVSRMSFAGRTPVLVTTNGTRALVSAAACADQVLLASFLDLGAVARHLTATAVPSVVLLPAGNFASGEGCIEDDLCADALQVLLCGGEPDLVQCAASIRAHPRIRGRLRAEPGFCADLDIALQGDPCPAVLKFQPLDAGVGYILRA